MDKNKTILFLPAKIFFLNLAIHKVFMANCFGEIGWWK